MSDAHRTESHRDLLSWRSEFPILDETVYLINNSLGAMPRGVYDELRAFADTWARRGVRAWSEGWWESAITTGDLLAPILGVPTGTVAMHQNVSIAVGLFLSAMDYPKGRDKIVTTALNFPSLLYLAYGEEQRGAHVVVVPTDDGIGIPTERLLAAIDEGTRLVLISHTLFKSAFVQDAPLIAKRCREVGALFLLDVYQSAGSVPLALQDWGVDAAVGGSVKWLCGGPGAAYLWVRPELARDLSPRFTGWQADRDPFSFHPGPIEHANGAWRFLTGTPNVPALHSCRAGYRIIAEVGVERIRQRSLALTARLIDHAEQAGFEVRTPRLVEQRGGTVSIWHPDAERLAEALIERQIICDFRPGGGVRLSPHFYNSEEECDRAIEALREAARS